MNANRQNLGSVADVAPVFLSGVYRSGTTFLTAVINNLQSFAAASSSVKYMRFCVPHFDVLENEQELDLLLDDVARRLLVRWDLTLDKSDVQKGLENRPLSHASVYDAVMSSLLLSDKPGTTRWAEKLAMQWRDIPKFLNMFPDGKAIHIFRDPRDVTASYKKMTFEPWPTFMDAALNCKSAMIDVPRIQKAFGDDRVLILRAEDLATDLKASMLRICDFLGEDFDPKSANLDEFSDIKGEDWRTNSSFEPEGTNFSAAKPRFQDHLTKEELFLVELICQPEMSQLGYPGVGGMVQSLDYEKIGAILGDPWMSERINNFLVDGIPAQGYRTDPIKTERKIVYGDN